MYTIKAYVDGKEYTIHDARVKALTVGGNPYFEIGDNINGSATFKVFPTHPYYDKVKKLTTDIVIYRDDEPEFYGRVLYDDEDFSGTKKVFVEGELAFLCDSIQRPKVYHNISVKAYVQDLIDIHNAQVEERNGQCFSCLTTRPTAMRSICGLSQQRKQVIWSRSSGELKSRKSSRTRF